MQNAPNFNTLSTKAFGNISLEILCQFFITVHAGRTAKIMEAIVEIKRDTSIFTERQL